MPSRLPDGPEPILMIPGSAADHLFREGSAKASFWEAIFGSSLRAKTRAKVSALTDGTRRFDVPLLSVEHELLRSAATWMTSEEFADACREAAALVAAKRVRITLVGLQPRGQAVASFALRFDADPSEGAISPAIAGAFRSWFGAEGARIARETLIPYGFTPHTA